MSSPATWATASATPAFEYGRLNWQADPERPVGVNPAWEWQD
ncbi:MAG: hypothetical protein ACRDHL_06670 [Candidatus Promineifilaceae bacterium]